MDPSTATEDDSNIAKDELVKSMIEECATALKTVDDWEIEPFIKSVS